MKKMPVQQLQLVSVIGELLDKLNGYLYLFTVYSTAINDNSSIKGAIGDKSPNTCGQALSNQILKFIDAGCGDGTITNLIVQVVECILLIVYYYLT